MTSDFREIAPTFVLSRRGSGGDRRRRSRQGDGRLAAEAASL